MTRLDLWGAFGINAAGAIAGVVKVPGTPSAPLGIRAVVYMNGLPRELEPGGTQDSAASDINRDGWAIGMRGDAPVLFLDGSTYDLNALVVSGLNGVRLHHVRAINDRGQIAANGCAPPNSSGPCTAFRLDPIPDVPPQEVPALSSLGMGTTVILMIATAGWSWRARSVTARQR